MMSAGSRNLSGLDSRVIYIAVLEHEEVTNTADVLAVPLDECVATGALNTLVKGDSQLSLSFEVDDYEVEIEGDTVRVRSAILTVNTTP